MELPGDASGASGEEARGGAAGGAGAGAGGAAGPGSLVARALVLPIQAVSLIAHYTQVVLGKVVPGLGPAGRIPTALEQQRQFLRRFEATHGSEHPPLFDGSYRTLTETCKREARMAVVYLHSPLHYKTDDFCRIVLPAPEFTELLQRHQALFWWGDVRDQEAFQVSETLGATDYPFLALLCPSVSRGGLTLSCTVAGATLPEECVPALDRAMSAWGAELVALRAERDERSNARQLREQQEAEYQEVMRQDAEAMRQREAEEAREREAQRAAEAARLERERAERAEAERRAEAEHRARLEREERDRIIAEKTRLLAAEPPQGPDATDLVIRLPNGGVPVKRRFLKRTTLAEVMDFLETKDVDSTKYRLGTSFPRKVYTDMSRTLQEENLLQSQLICVEIEQ